jgi:integration host factor subunit alpha
MSRRLKIMTLTKDQIIQSVHQNLDIPKAKSSEIFEYILEEIKSKLESGEDVLISGFGKFSVKQKNERKGRNPATGETMMLAPRRVVTFGCSPVLRTKINGQDPS